MFISAYGPGSEEEIEEFQSELSECVGSRNESAVVLAGYKCKNRKWTD